MAWPHRPAAPTAWQWSEDYCSLANLVTTLEKIGKQKKSVKSVCQLTDGRILIVSLKAVAAPPKPKKAKKPKAEPPAEVVES